MKAKFKTPHHMITQSLHLHFVWAHMGDERFISTMQYLTSKVKSMCYN